MRKGNISENAIRRLPRYLRQLEKMGKDGWEKITSGQLGKQLGFTASQIRQDLSYFGAFGHPGYGYDVHELAENMRSVLGADLELSAILIGAGNIGKALLCNFCFSQCAISMKAAFDTDSEIIGKSISGVEIYNVAELLPYIENNPTDIAVLCVPQSAADEYAQLLRQLGVVAIWNFTNTELLSPASDVIVENVHLSDSLLTISYMLTEKRDRNSKPRFSHMPSENRPT